MIRGTYSTNVYKLCLPTTTTTHIIDINEIIRIQSISNYSKLYFSDGKTLVVAKLLRWFEEELKMRDFVRVHRTHLINTDYIDQYRSDKNGNKLRLTNGEQIDVSRRKASFLKNLKEQAVGGKMVISQAC